jgi:hypothetical protein
MTHKEIITLWKLIEKYKDECTNVNTSDDLDETLIKVKASKQRLHEFIQST